MSSFSRGHLVLLFLSSLAICNTQNVSDFGDRDILKYIDPFIGTTAGGHVFPGATLPYGMAKAVADVGDENQGGFSFGSQVIYGFSHMHDSGTGGSPSLGNFPIMPYESCPGDIPTNCRLGKEESRKTIVPGSPKASPGYFSIEVGKNITAEMTVTSHTAIYRFSFPTRAGTAKPVPLISLELTDLPNTRAEGGLEIDPITGRMTGNGTFRPSFGIGRYTSYFCADFRGAKLRDSGVYKNNQASTKAKFVRVVPDGVNGKNGVGPVSAGGFVQFDTPADGSTLLVRVGVSLISAQQACRSAEKEIPHFDFNLIHAEARLAWREKLSSIEVDSTNISLDLKKTFWSGIYRSFISPQDYTGENPLWKSKEPYFDSFYCIWDSFRSLHQLLTLMDPHEQTRMIRSLIDIYRHEGKLPDCRMSLCKGFTQGGSNADILLVDSWLKNISLGVDWETGYKAMVSDAEDEPLNWGVEGRGGLTSWKELGYIPKDDFDPYGTGAFTRSISRTVEYAYNDFTIGLMAKGTGRMDDYKKYMERSNNWKNLYKEDQRSYIKGFDTGFTGYLQPKALNGTFEFQDPTICSHENNFDGCYLNTNGLETYEGSPWMYTFFVPGDMASLIKTLGGPDSLVRRLDYYHTTELAYIGDEQGFLPVFQYHYAARPGLSSFRAHYYIPSQFNSTIAGIPGNDDSGAMGSFAALSMMGIFPNAGQNVYLLTAPFFKRVAITNRMTGKKAVIRSINFDSAYRNIYIQKATLNGKSHTKSWIDHSFFLKGGVLELTLGPNESDWGTRDEDLPPSLSTGGY